MSRPVVFLSTALLLAGAAPAHGQDSRPAAGVPDSLANVRVVAGDSVRLAPDGLDRIRRRIATLRGDGVVRQVVYPIIVLVPTGSAGAAARLPAMDLAAPTDTTRTPGTPTAPVPFVYDAPVEHRGEAVYRDRAVYLAPVVYRDSVFYEGPVVYRDSIVYRERTLPPPLPAAADTARAEPTADTATPVARALVETGLLDALTVVFPHDETTLLPAVEATLNTLGAVLERYPTLELTLTGHADGTGPATYNQRLSERRAEAVRRYLIDHFAIAPDRLTIRGAGETRPVADNADPTGRTLNRRVTFTVRDDATPDERRP